MLNVISGNRSYDLRNWGNFAAINFVGGGIECFLCRARVVECLNDRSTGTWVINLGECMMGHEFFEHVLIA